MAPSEAMANRNKSFAAVRLSIQRPSLGPQTIELCFHSGFPSFADTLSLHFTADAGFIPDDATGSNSKTASMAFRTNSGQCGIVHCVLASVSQPHDGCCLSDTATETQRVVGVSPQDPAPRHSSLKRSLPTDLHDAGVDDGASPKRMRCADNSIRRQSAPPATTACSIPDANYVVRLGLVKLYPTDDDFHFNGLDMNVAFDSHIPPTPASPRRAFPALTHQLRLFVETLRWDTVADLFRRIRASAPSATTCAALAFILALLLGASQLRSSTFPAPSSPNTSDAPSSQPTHLFKPIPEYALDWFARSSANLIRYSSVARVLALGYAQAGPLHNATCRYRSPEPGGFAVNAARHFVPEEYFLSDLGLILDDVLWDMVHVSQNASELASRNNTDMATPSLNRLQKQLTDGLFELTTLTSKARAIMKHWVASASLVSTSRMLTLLDIYHGAVDFDDFHPDPTTTPTTPPVPATPAASSLLIDNARRLAKDTMGVPESFSSAWAAHMSQRAHMSERLNTSSPGQATSTLDAREATTTDSTRSRLVEIVNTPLMAVDFDNLDEPRRTGVTAAGVQREGTLALYARSVEKTCGLVLDLVGRINYIISHLPDPLPRDVAPDAVPMSRADFGLARIHRTAPFLNSIAAARLAQMRERASCAITVLREVADEQLRLAYSINATPSGMFPDWQVLAADAAHTDDWVYRESRDLFLETRMREVDFLAAVDQIEDDDGRMPAGIIWSRWHMGDHREDPYARDRMVWWQYRRPRDEDTPDKAHKGWWNKFQATPNPLRRLR